MITTELDINAIKQFVDGYFHADVALERVKSGVSTYVYRIHNKGDTYYLRVLPEDTSYAAEAKAHEIMLGYGVNVPKPLYYEHKNSVIGKSIMLTSEIAGECIAGDEEYVSRVLHEAGKQLAAINSINVDGFSWIDRSVYTRLAGEKQTFHEYYYDKLYSDIGALGQYGFDAEHIKGMLDEAFKILDTDDSRLVHGDFDDTHIFHIGGLYSGFIDFGEVRGSHVLYDLGHYKLHDSHNGFAYLSEGYSEIHKLTSEDRTKIDYLALFVGISRSKYEHYRNLIRKQLLKMKGEI
jgi:aminoglycoside phosphotransferase (APT) family kinase protein